ncbi:MAG: hypothetical protein AAGF11_41245 [Myxococcota bacterium]
MKYGAVPVDEILDEGARLTGGFHLSEDRRAMATIRRAGLPTVPLVGLTRDPGIFRGPIFSRRLVDDPRHGEPYGSAKDLTAADVRPAAYLSRTHGALLDTLRLREGMILVTRSGVNLGQVIWTRPDLAGLVASDDLIRICPDPAAIAPGYLYAFLAGRYGRALIRKQIYGGHIKHIEPQHIAALAVPRLGADLEGQVHAGVERAAQERTRAAAQLRQADAAVRSWLGADHAAPAACSPQLPWTSVSATQLQARCDAYYWSGKCLAARRVFDTAGVGEHRALGEVAEVFVPGIFKRHYVEDPRHGVPYITGADVFSLTPRSDRFLLRRVVVEHRLDVHAGTILVQEAGQLGGLLGHCVRVGAALDGFAVSNNMARVRPYDRRDAGFLMALLSTDEGVTLLAREAAGSSIPHIEAARLRALVLPWPKAEVRHEIGARVDDAIVRRDTASLHDDNARTRVEQAIAAAGSRDDPAG